MAKKPNFKKASNAAAATRRVLGSKPPFDPEKIAEEKNIQVVYAKFQEPYNKKISGFYRKSDNKIVINKDIAPNRMIFTIAHELGHAVLHQEYIKSKDYQPVFRSNVHIEEKPVEEVEADTFAANFLVPLDILRKYKDVADVSELATMFAVSEDVIENRLDLLRRHPNLAT